MTLSLLLAACGDASTSAPSHDSGSPDSGDYGESDTDTDTDTDTDSDTDSDTDTDADMDTGEAEDTDTGTDTDTEVCDAETPVVLYVSPDDSNSMSSAAQARVAILGDWSALSYVPIRTWEFLNYYDFDYSPAGEGTLAVTPQLVQNDDGTWQLQVGVASEARSNDDRYPINVTLSLDTSGSMAGDPLELLQETAYAIASSLREGDVVSIVAWSTTNTVLLEDHAVSGPDDATLLRAIENVSTGGSTDLYSGLEAAYELAERNYTSDRINRVVLISDGGANVGVTSSELIAQYAADNDRDGIYMVGVGVGTASSYQDELMDTVTDLGRGASVFVGEPEEAWRMFGEDRFVSTMDVAQRNVSIELDLPPGFEIVRFSGEEFSTDPTEIEPQHIAPDDAMVFYMTLDTCAPEEVTDASELVVTATWTDPVTLEDESTSVTRTFGQLLAGDNALLAKGAAVYGYAEGLKAWKAAGSDAARRAAIDGALERLYVAQAQNPGDADLDEIEVVLRVLE